MRAIFSPFLSASISSRDAHYVWDGLEEGYSAACQDEAEAVRGLVEALEKIAEYPMERSQEKSYATCRAISAAALKAWKGE